MNPIIAYKKSSTRYLYLDLLRILGITLILCEHVVHPFFIISPWYGNFFIGGVGIFIFVLASGAGLAYNNTTFKIKNDYLRFYLKHYIKIYLSLWVALFLSFIINPIIQGETKFLLFTQFTGTFPYFNQAGRVDVLWDAPTWFIGMIVALYLFYPLLYKFISKNAEIKVILLVGFSFGFKLVAVYYQDFGIINLNYWCPLTYIGVFSIGIYMVKFLKYPKKESKNMIIIRLSEMALFIFLIQMPILIKFGGNYPIIALAGIFLLAYMMYLFDRHLTGIINPYINRYLR